MPSSNIENDVDSLSLCISMIFWQFVSAKIALQQLSIAKQT